MSKMKRYQGQLLDLENNLWEEQEALNQAWSSLRSSIKTRNIEDMVQTHKIIIKRVLDIATRLSQLMQAELDSFSDTNSKPHNSQLSFKFFDDEESDHE